MASASKLNREVYINTFENPAQFAAAKQSTEPPSPSNNLNI